MNSNARATTSKLWVITSYFNPVGYQNRKLNYQRFRDHLKLPLVTAELCVDSSRDLQSTDAEILLTFSDGDIMWQKERLLNLAIQALPDECEAVAWLDCDILFDCESWARLAMERLDRYTMLHAFNRIYDVPKGREGDWFRFRNENLVTHSSIEAWVEGTLDESGLLGSGSDFNNGRSRQTREGVAIGTGGIGWVARREFIEQQTLYDGCVVGGGDGVLAQAVFGLARHQVAAKSMSPPYAKHYLDWAEGFHGALGNDFSYVKADAFHLWHGGLEDRKYTERHQEFAAFDFDPYHDIEISTDGCWKWSSDIPKMHRYVREFFLDRKEDG